MARRSRLTWVLSTHPTLAIQLYRDFYIASIHIIDFKDSAMSIEDRVRALEDFNLKTKTIVMVLGLIGLGLGAAFAYLAAGITDVQNQLNASNETAIGLEERLLNIGKGIDGLVADSVSESSLIVSFSNESVLAQVQAQAICTAIAPRATTVMAVLRKPTGRNAEGKNVSERCPEICPRYTMVGTGKEATMVGAVHVYSSKPPFSSASQITNPGLATHVYRTNDNNDQFGPNYCCCAG